jgi:hypothetical protein
MFVNRIGLANVQRHYVNPLEPRECQNRAPCDCSYPPTYFEPLESNPVCWVEALSHNAHTSNPATSRVDIQAMRLHAPGWAKRKGVFTRKRGLIGPNSFWKLSLIGRSFSNSFWKLSSIPHLPHIWRVGRNIVVKETNYVVAIQNVAYGCKPAIIGQDASLCFKTANVD